MLCRSLVDHAVRKIAKAADADEALENFEGFAGIYLPPISLSDARAEATLKTLQKYDRPDKFSSELLFRPNDGPFPTGLSTFT